MVRRAASSACCTMKSETDVPRMLAARSMRLFWSGRMRASIRCSFCDLASVTVMAQHSSPVIVRQIAVHCNLLGGDSGDGGFEDFAGEDEVLGRSGAAAVERGCLAEDDDVFYFCRVDCGL